MQARNIIYRNNRNMIFDIVFGLFEWKLPEGCNAKTHEYNLMTTGQGAIFWEEKFNSFINTQITGQSSLDIYGFPFVYNCIGVGYNRTMHRDKIAYMFNTVNIYGENRIICQNSPLSVIDYYANKLTDIDIAIQNNINSNKRPYIIGVGDPKQVKAVREALRQSCDGEPLVIVDGDKFTGVNTSVMKIDSPLQVEALQAARRNTIHECLSRFGINSLQDDKRERMITAEAESNLDSLAITLRSMLDARLEGCERFYKLYGEIIDCKPRFMHKEEIYNYVENNTNPGSNAADTAR